MRRILICFLAFLLPVTGFCDKKEKKSSETKLFQFDEEAFQNTIEAVLELDDYKDLENKDRTLIRMVLKTVVQKYLENNLYRASVQDIESAVDSIADLNQKIQRAADEYGELFAQCEDLNNLVANLTHDKDSLLQEQLKLGAASQEGIRIMRIVSGRIEEVENRLDSAHNTSLQDLEEGFYDRLKVSYESIRPISLLLAPDRDKVLLQKLDSIAVVEEFRSVISRSNTFFSGLYEKQTRIGLLDELNALNRKESLLSDVQREDVAQYLSALQNEGRYVFRFASFLNDLLKEGCIVENSQLENWQKKTAQFKLDMDPSDGCVLMDCLQKGVDRLAGFLHFDRNQKIPKSLSDFEFFEKEIKSIFASVTDLTFDQFNFD